MNEREYFTEAEARALLGRRVRTRSEWGDAREDTAGVVTRVEQSTTRLGWIVGITWDWPRKNDPLMDWFDRGQYERWIKEP